MNPEEGFEVWPQLSNAKHEVSNKDTRSVYDSEARKEVGICEVKVV